MQKQYESEQEQKQESRNTKQSTTTAHRPQRENPSAGSRRRTPNMSHAAAKRLGRFQPPTNSTYNAGIYHCAQLEGAEDRKPKKKNNQDSTKPRTSFLITSFCCFRTNAMPLLIVSRHQFPRRPPLCLRRTDSAFPSASGSLASPV